ncbi:MAG: RcnB family protein [Pseudomonas sp.]
MNRKRLGITLLTSLLALGCVAPSAFAWDGDRDRPGWDRGRDRDWREDRRREWRDDRRHYDNGYREGYRDARWNDRRDYGYYRPAPPRPYWARGQRYYGPVYVVDDYDRYDVRRPPRGYRWQRDDTGNLLLVAIATGIITDIVLNH